MLKAPIPVNEPSRMRRVQELKLLDTPPEERFNRITRLAQAYFHTPFVLLTLVDENRIWFKANLGFGATQSPRDTSFCGHAIVHDEDIFTVEDAREDSRFVDNPYVVGDANVRFYAGAPLEVDGERVGTLCLVDQKKRTLSQEELSVLRDLAAIAENELNMLDLKVAMDRLQQAKRFFDVSQDLLCTINYDGIFTYMTPNWSQVMGYSLHDMLGHRFLDFVYEGDLEKTEKEFAEVSHIGRTAFNFENRYRAKDGSVRSFLWNATAFPDEKVLFCGARDITEKNRIEHMKDEFVAHVSHELRTPITSINGSLKLMEAGVMGELPPEAKPLAHIAISNCDRLVRLINDILDLDKIESGKMEFNRTNSNLSAVVKDAVSSNEGYGSQFGVKINYLPGLETLEAQIDTDRITQVVTNLISNAVKFSAKGSNVDVFVTRNGHDARVSVRDHGMGIPEEFRSRIFGKFEQSAAGKTKKASTGLGLNICKAIVENHGGTIGFDSTSSGTTFYFDLPI